MIGSDLRRVTLAPLCCPHVQGLIAPISEKSSNYDITKTLHLVWKRQHCQIRFYGRVVAM
jgi:hypothetical protein